jgi:CheY-like chemotaxis protein
MTKRVLIVDDEDDIRDVVQVSLEEFAGWQAVTAASGAEGLQLAQTEVLDAILLDLSMPDMDGFELCQALKADPAIRQVPVIVLTAKVLPSDQRQLEDLDVAGMITKPFDPITIWQEIAQILGWN